MPPSLGKAPSGLLKGSQGQHGRREYTGSPCVPPRPSSQAYSWLELGSLGAQWFYALNGTLYVWAKLSLRAVFTSTVTVFTDVKKLKSTVYVCSRSPCKVSMSALQGLCPRKFSSTVLTFLPSSLCQSTCHVNVCVCVYMVNSPVGAVLSPRGQLAMSGDIFGLLWLGGGGGGMLLLASRGWRPRMLLNILKGTG